MSQVEPDMLKRKADVLDAQRSKDLKAPRTGQSMKVVREALNIIDNLDTETVRDLLFQAYIGYPEVEAIVKDAKFERQRKQTKTAAQQAEAELNQLEEKREVSIHANHTNSEGTPYNTEARTESPEEDVYQQQRYDFGACYQACWAALTNGRPDAQYKTGHHNGGQWSKKANEVYSQKHRELVAGYMGNVQTWQNRKEAFETAQKMFDAVIFCSVGNHPATEQTATAALTGLAALMHFVLTHMSEDERVASVPEHMLQRFREYGTRWPNPISGMDLVLGLPGISNRIAAFDSA